MGQDLTTCNATRNTSLTCWPPPLLLLLLQNLPQYQFVLQVTGSPAPEGVAGLLSSALQAGGEFLCDMVGVSICGPPLNPRTMCSAYPAPSSSIGLLCTLPQPPQPVTIAVTLSAEDAVCIEPLPGGLQNPMVTSLVAYLQGLVGTGVVVSASSMTCLSEWVSRVGLRV